MWVQDQDGRVSVVEVNKAWTPPEEPFLTMLVALLEKGTQPYRWADPLAALKESPPRRPFDGATC